MLLAPLLLSLVPAALLPAPLLALALVWVQALSLVLPALLVLVGAGAVIEY